MKRKCHHALHGQREWAKFKSLFVAVCVNMCDNTFIQNILRGIRYENNKRKLFLYKRPTDYPWNGIPSRRE